MSLLYYHNKGMGIVNMESRNNSSNTIKELLQWIEAIVFAVIIAFFIRGFIFEPVYVQGESMADTLNTSQRLIVYKLGYSFASPQHGDIVVLQIQEGTLEHMPFLKNFKFVRKVIPDLDEVDYIKRVIGLPGDKIYTKDGFVYVNGNRLDEPYAKGLTYRIDKPLEVPENKVFVLGDNRENSRDSRDIGFVDFDKIKGKAVLRIWPLDVFGGIYGNASGTR